MNEPNARSICFPVEWISSMLEAILFCHWWFLIDSPISLSDCDMFNFQLLLAYAGPSSNVRIERTSRDCFKDGGALADVMSLYEDIGEDSSILEDNELNTEVMKVGNHLHGIEVCMF